MGYSEFNPDLKAVEGFADQRKKLYDLKTKHQQTDECTGRAYCPICRKIDKEIELCDPTLP